MLVRVLPNPLLYPRYLLIILDTHLSLHLQPLSPSAPFVLYIKGHRYLSLCFSPFSFSLPQLPSIFSRFQSTFNPKLHQAPVPPILLPSSTLHVFPSPLFAFGHSHSTQQQQQHQHQQNTLITTATITSTPQSTRTTAKDISPPP